MSEQGGVVAGADLQDPLTRLGANVASVYAPTPGRLVEPEISRVSVPWIEGNFPPPLTVALTWADRALGAENLPVIRPIGLLSLPGRELPCCDRFAAGREFLGGG